MNIHDTLQKADTAFNQWKKVSFEKRQQLFGKLAEVLEAHKEEMAKIITSEMNKPMAQSVAEIEKCALMTRYYAAAPNVIAPEQIETEFRLSEIRYVPKGVILGVMPWNFPFWQALRFAVPAILAGNTVVLKHASICFGTGNRIERAFLEAGFPEGIFQNMEIGHKEVKEVLENPIVQGVSLTGSEKAGAEVASTAGQQIKKSLLELGGSDAFIVFADAELDKAAQKGANSRLANCGQACNAAKRFIIESIVADEFISKLKTEFSTYQPADPFDKTTKIAGMARKDLADELEKQYREALDNGAEILLPLERISDLEFKPGLIKVAPGNPILNEEVFGPLGLVMTADDQEAILQYANDIPFGLSNSVWTADKERQNYFIENLDSGTVSVNKSSSSDPRLPFGGTKTSGYGSELSLIALREFVNIKTVVGN